LVAQIKLQEQPGNKLAAHFLLSFKKISMKKLILLLVVFISLLATKSFAQNGDRMQQMQQQFRSFLKDSVQLSDAMADSVISIRQQYQPQVREIFMDQSASMSDKQAKMQGLRSQMDVRYKAAGITDDQIAAIHKHEDWMHQQMMNRMNNGGGGGQ
jgi:hypothetical protein